MNKQQKYKYIEDPSRNFNILSSTTIIDPLDGREKLVLSNFASGSTGSLVFIDTETGAGEAIKLPGDEGAWAILNLNNKNLLVGTCSGYGYLHNLDLESRTWAKPLRDEHESYIWNLTLASDGMVYGGTYPGCVLLRYDPEKHVLENMGKVSDNPKNLYSRNVDGGVPGYVIISGGMDTHFAIAYHIETRSFKPFLTSTETTIVQGSTEEYIRLEMDGHLVLYDPKTFKPMNNPADQDSLTQASGFKPVQNQIGQFQGLQLRDGMVAGVRGQDYYLKAPQDDKPKLIRIPTPAPATLIHNIASDAQGNIWGASGFGQTIFCYKPESRDLWNSSTVCDCGGEVYGICFVGERLFLSSYSGGDHMVYNPHEPWDQLNNVNPKTLMTVAPALIRPTGRSVLGPDGAVWTGWSAKYGVYGGGLSRIDASTLEVESWYDPIPEQQVAGLTADDQYLYFTTNGGASGLSYNEVSCHFAVWSAEGKVVHQQTFDKQHKLDAVLAVGGRVLVRVSDEINIFDPAAMKFDKTIETGKPCTWMIAIDDETAGLFCGSDFYLMNVFTGEFEHGSELPGQVSSAAKTPDGKIYFAQGTALYELQM
jgi:hypothetical protein